MSIPFNITTGKGTTLTTEISSNTVSPLSTFTGMPVTFSVNTSAIPSNYKKDFVVFSINDNFLLKENNSTYNCPLPGIYKVTLFLADEDGESVESFTAEISAFNYITDIIVPQFRSTPLNNIYNNSSTDPYNCISEAKLQTSIGLWFASAYNFNPIQLIRYNTWQLCGSLSAIDYKIDLHCDNSKAVNYLKEKDYYTQNLLNYPIWQFTQDGASPQGGQRSSFIDHLSTTSENIFLTYDGVTGSISTVSGENTVFCGTSGSNYCYFKDDIPNRFDYLYFTQNLQDIPLKSFLLDNKNIQIFDKNLPVINNSSVGLTANIIENTPIRLGFSFNGIDNTYPTSLFNGSQYPTFIGIRDSFNNNLKYFPKLTLVSRTDTLTANTIKVALLSAGSQQSGGAGDNVYLVGDLSLVQTSLSSYQSNTVDLDTLSSFAVTVLSTDYDPSFEFSGVFNTITVIQHPIYETRRTAFNPCVLSATGVISVDGTSANNINLNGLLIENYYPNYIQYDILKQNENFDYTSTLKSYAFMPSLEAQTNLFDYFFSYVGGDEKSSPNELGKRIYEKTANFVSNISDVDRANITELYGLFDEIGYKTTNYSIKFPSNLQRMLDLLSISYNKLIGTDTGYSLNYDPNANIDSIYKQSNIGERLTNSSIISAGVNIVIHQYYQDKYYTITPTIVPITTELLSSYSINNPNAIDSTFGGLSAYPLSGYQNNWNWGLPSDVNWSSIVSQHEFFLQVPTDVTSINKISSVIDWSNFQTTLTSLQHDSNLFNYFTVSGGLMEQYIENELRKGVGLL